MSTLSRYTYIPGTPAPRPAFRVEPTASSAAVLPPDPPKPLGGELLCPYCLTSTYPHLHLLQEANKRVEAAQAAALDLFGRLVAIVDALDDSTEENERLGI
ncbi:hypothetical protein JCM10213_001847 [Rhodosporidiobolus nylandii]